MQMTLSLARTRLSCSCAVRQPHSSQRGKLPALGSIVLQMWDHSGTLGFSLIQLLLLKLWLLASLLRPESLLHGLSVSCKNMAGMSPTLEWYYVMYMFAAYYSLGAQCGGPPCFVGHRVMSTHYCDRSLCSKGDAWKLCWVLTSAYITTCCLQFQAEPLCNWPC